MKIDGRYVVSGFKNSCVPSFKLPVNRASHERVIAHNYQREVPGPGTYSPCVTDRTNKYRNS